MGLAAGINFSLRSVAAQPELRIAAINRNSRSRPMKSFKCLAGPDGAALDETGFVLITANELRLLDAWPCYLSAPSGAVDWSALLGIMSVAAQQRRDPFHEAVRVQERLFTTKPIFLGVEESLKHPDVPCGLKTDAERARHVRQHVREMLNSRGEWERVPAPVEKPVREIFVMPTIVAEPPSSTNANESPMKLTAPELRPALSQPDALEKIGTGIFLRII